LVSSLYSNDPWLEDWNAEPCTSNNAHQSCSLRWSKSAPARLSRALSCYRRR
jgi:hypothetical protein